MKKLIIGVLLIIVVLVSIIAIKTAAYKSKQIVSTDGKRNNYAMDESAIKHLSEAVKIATISYDDTTKFNQAAFDSLFTFLHTQYPAVFEKLDDTLINKRNLLLKWNGSNTATKPVIYYAHLDVVPIEENTLQEWKHQPFSGDVADGFIWGRGTLDDKGSVIAIFESLNRLIANGFTPQRTVYFAFGSDEEIGGANGAQVIADYLRKQELHFEFYMDEGGMVSEGLVPNVKHPVALIGTAEKGYVTLELSVNMKGGHSSRPPRESSVDVLVAAVKKLHDNQDERQIAEPVENFLSYVGPEMGMPLKAVFANKWLFKPLILNEYEKSAEGYALLRTTEVATVINAGVKENIVPSLVTAKINYRVLTGQTTDEVIKNAKKLIDDDRVEVAKGEVYEPSKNSTTDSYGFQLMQKTMATVYPDALVAPFLMIGSTDSKHFQDLTDNTYRFFPARMDRDLVGTIHGINERIRTEDFMETIQFYQTMLTNLK